MPLRIVFPLAVCVALVPVAACAEEHRIASDDALKTLCDSSTVQPGDTIIWEAGVYLDQRLYVAVSGTAEAPITLRAETPGGVMMKGESAIKFGGDHLVVSREQRVRDPASGDERLRELSRRHGGRA